VGDEEAINLLGTLGLGEFLILEVVFSVERKPGGDDSIAQEAVGEADFQVVLLRIYSLHLGRLAVEFEGQPLPCGFPQFARTLSEAAQNANPLPHLVLHQGIAIVGGGRVRGMLVEEGIIPEVIPDRSSKVFHLETPGKIRLKTEFHLDDWKLSQRVSHEKTLPNLPGSRKREPELSFYSRPPSDRQRWVLRLAFCFYYARHLLLQSDR
jgi:hypothetical protein